MPHLVFVKIIRRADFLVRAFERELTTFRIDLRLEPTLAKVLIVDLFLQGLLFFRDESLVLKKSVANLWDGHILGLVWEGI